MARTRSQQSEVVNPLVGPARLPVDPGSPPDAPQRADVGVAARSGASTGCCSSTPPTSH